MKRIRFMRALLATPEARRALGYVLMSVAALCVGAASVLAPGVSGVQLHQPARSVSPNENGEPVSVQVWISLGDRAVLVAATPTDSSTSTPACRE